MRRLSATLLLLTFALVPGFAQVKDAKGAGDWPVFRANPQQTGVATSALPEKLEVLWQVKTGDSIEGAAAVVEGIVYVGSYDQHLYAIDLAAGKVKWKFKAGPFKAPPSVREGLVYVGDADGIFYCLEAATGKKRWSFETEGEIAGGATFTKDAVLFGSGDEQLYCLTLEGKERWKFKVPGGPVMATPSLAGDRTFVAGCDSNLHIIDTNTGKEVAAVDVGSQVGAAAPVMGDRVYVPTMGNHVLAIDWKKAEIVWTYEARRLPKPFYSSAALTDDLVIAGSRDKHVHAIDRTTGKGVWTFPTEGKVDSSPVVAGKRIIVGSEDEHLYVLDLAKGTALSKIKLDGPIIASPVVAGNCLIIGTEKGTVYCIGATK